MRYFRTPFGHVCYALAFSDKHLKRIRKDTGIGKDSPSAEFEAYSIHAICLDLFQEYRGYINGRDTTAA